MPYVSAQDGVKLYYEETGTGVPLVFCHEYGNDYRAWEAQLRYFGKRYRCIAFNARGFPPSDVPEALQAYSQEQAVRDLAAVITALELAPAHVVGLAMGSFTTLFHSLACPASCRSQVVAACGYGADLDRRHEHEAGCEHIAQAFEREGSAATAAMLAAGPARRQLKNKNPRAWQEFLDAMSHYSNVGAAHCQRGVLMRRPSVYQLETQLNSVRMPTLLIVGDEDEPALLPNLYLKRSIPSAGLCVLPNSGHTLNLEDPELFNSVVADFLWKVECGRWPERDPTSRFQQ
jgi:pimeloyl-ACP methyl ester carboxylesterase